MVLEIAPLDAGEDSPSPTPVELFGVGAGGQGQFVLELDAIAPAVIHVDVGDLVIRLAGIMVGDPAEVDLPVMIPGRAGVVGNKRRPALRASTQPRTRQMAQQQQNVKQAAHGKTRSLRETSPGIAGQVPDRKVLGPS